MHDHAIVAADPSGRITLWSSGASELFGFSSQEAIGQSLDLIVPDHLQEAHWRGFNRAMQTGEIRLTTAEAPVRCRDGQIRSFPARMQLLTDAEHAVIGAMVIYSQASNIDADLREDAPCPTDALSDDPIGTSGSATLPHKQVWLR